ncbi:hypothetical protein M1112_00315 [Candidatus Parvarchaeota archaeon]|jgi:hypothetical protein|nr:hypothetical protein [Candidatus Parvarchaeota archaeon]
MSSGFYEAAVIAIVGVVIIVSVLRFIRAFYRNPTSAVQLIRLNNNSVYVFILFLSMNFIFTLGYIFQIVYIVNNSDLIAILIYAIGTAFFFSSLTRIISKKYKLK